MRCHSALPLLLPLALAATLLHQPLLAADWPMFRADVLRSARAEGGGYAEVWPEGGPPLVWRRDGLGRTRSSLVVRAGVVYLAQERDLLALEAATGALRWQIPCRVGSSTPVVTETQIVVLNGSECRAHALTDGRLIWTTRIDDLVNGLDEWDVKYDGWSQSPLVVDDQVIIAVGHPEVPVIALSLRDGSLRWRATPSEQQAARYRSYASSLFVQRGATPLVVAHFGIVIAGVDARDGRVLWEYTTNVEDKFRGTQKLPLANSCVLHEDLLISVSSHHYGGPNQQSALRLAADGRSVQKAWHNPVICPHQEGVLLLDGMLYGTGTVTWDQTMSTEAAALIDGMAWEEARVHHQLEAPNAGGRDRPVRLPGASKYAYGIVCQDAASGSVRGIRYGLTTGGWGGGFVGHVLVAAGPRIIALPTSFMQEAWLLEPGPALRVVGRLVLPPGEHRKGKPDMGDDDRWSMPAIADGLGFFRLNDMLLVYDLRAP